MLLLSACSEDSNKTEPGASQESENLTTVVEPGANEPEATELVAETSSQAAGIMTQPVDFSTPESVEKTLQAIEAEAGERAAGHVRNAIDWMLVYDLSVKRDKDQLYRKLDGKTPDEIIDLTRH